MATLKEIIEAEEFRPLFRPPSPGEIVQGKVIGWDKAGLFLDLGNFGVGVISGKELLGSKTNLKNLEPGQEVSAKVAELDNEEGYVELSVNQAREELAWLSLKERQERKEILAVKILKANRGGLITELEGIQAFLPVSQLSSEHYPRVEDGDQTKILKELQKFIDQELKVEILTINPRQRTLILSEKALDREKLRDLLADYRVGQEIEGKVSAIVDFGVFVKFPVDREPNIEGLIHISELSWQLVQNPSEVVQMGQKIRAKIIDISNNRVSLSLKALTPDPWQGAEKKYQKGDIVKGEVVKFNPFGAFVKIAPSIQGLIHISEFGNEQKMQNQLSLGKKYSFEIVLVSAKEHRLILKLASENKNGK